MTQTVPPGWYADPSGQHGSRWWDGNQWTEHIQPAAPQAQPGGGGHPGGVAQYGEAAQYGGAGQYGGSGQGQGAAVPGQTWGTPLGVQPGAVHTNYNAEQVQRQVQEQAGVQPAGSGGGTLFSEPVLVVNQKTKIIEVTNEYAVFDQGGRQIGSVVEVGQGALKKAARVLTSWDQYFSHRLEVRDAAGTVQLRLHRPAKVLKSKVIVSLPDGAEIGVIAQQNVFGRIRFDLQAGGTTIGAIKAENWRAWNFSIVDHADVEVARVTKTWEGLMRTMFTTADNYVVQIHRPLPQPLHSLVVAAALTIDTALKQDSRGLG
ncbi:phospholipid scramblase-related protein [Candidatus Frankia alpina]|uniref:DUF2510 domain-containing protein n=1 Tax=Candidatus Frankia alpina TaxID=2699483 RepID=A0A4V3Z4U6_9ACTN|nr:phospholipid scramblase-related protein [Candidatus Frankia alpina]THJ64009.1 DUF2510 domain-containing protein [Candidatus Frankia alpina]